MTFYRWERDAQRLKSFSRDLSGGPVAKTSCSQCSGLGFDPWSENQIAMVKLRVCMLQLLIKDPVCHNYDTAQPNKYINIKKKKKSFPKIAQLTGGGARYQTRQTGPRAQAFNCHVKLPLKLKNASCKNSTYSGGPIYIKTSLFKWNILCTHFKNLLRL